MRTLKSILISLCALCAVLAVATPFVSSFMQDHYKDKASELLDRTGELLEKKQFWAESSDTIIAICVAAFVITLLSALLIRRIEKYNTLK